MLTRRLLLTSVVGLLVSACSNKPERLFGSHAEFSHGKTSRSGASIPGPVVKIEPAVVFFKSDSAMIDSQAQKNLSQFINQFAITDWQPLLIEGHTDANHTDTYNLSLAERRSSNVRQRLIDMGYPAYYLKQAAQGERQPVASNSTHQGRRMNRRVLIRAY